MTTQDHDAGAGQRANHHEPITIGQLPAQTGLSIKAIREFERRGLIYTAGRSPANYGLFDHSAPALDP